jgi:hypothetical protein
MEENVVALSRSPRNPIMVTTGGGIVPLPPPSPIRTTTIPTPTTSGSGLIQLMNSTIVPFTQNATGAPFSYGIHDFDSNSVLTYSTLHTMGLGAGSCNTSLQGSTPFNVIPYGGGHIPPPSPLLDGSF